MEDYDKKPRGAENARPPSLGQLGCGRGIHSAMHHWATMENCGGGGMVGWPNRILSDIFDTIFRFMA